MNFGVCQKASWYVPGTHFQERYDSSLGALSTHGTLTASERTLNFISSQEKVILISAYPISLVTPGNKNNTSKSKTWLIPEASMFFIKITFRK